MWAAPQIGVSALLFDHNHSLLIPMVPLQTELANHTLVCAGPPGVLRPPTSQLKTKALSGPRIGEPPSPGFGWRQGLGVAIGVLVILGGLYKRHRQKPSLQGAGYNAPAFRCFSPKSWRQPNVFRAQGRVGKLELPGCTRHARHSAARLVRQDAE